MEDKGSNHVLDLYMKANKNKQEIVLTTEDGQSYSKAEMVVLSCLAMLVRSQEDEKHTIDYDKVIKAIILNSLDGMTDNLKRKDEFNRRIQACKELETFEDYGAVSAYERMLSGFKFYLNPEFVEEQFINNNFQLHNTKRTGHIYWGVKSDRIENVLEHIYGCLVLSIGLESEYDYSIDFNKLRRMLLTHEEGENIIKDKTYWDMNPKEKARIEREAFKRVVSILPDGEKIVKLFDEFEGRMTVESEYAFLIDKIEYDMQVKRYELDGRYDFNHIPENPATRSRSVQNIIANGAQGVFDVHYEYDKDKYVMVPCFRRLLDATKNLQK